jgi:hypothetical protein
VHAREWKISDNVWPGLKSAIEGYEDIVPFTYQTNIEYDDPFVGFLYATQFKHWGGSIQSWYWEKRTNETQDKMPVDLMAKHTVLVRNMGAEIIQFEPYWYFFDNEGEPMNTMYTMWSTVQRLISTLASLS